MTVYKKRYEDIGPKQVSWLMNDIYDALYDALEHGIEQYHAKVFARLMRYDKDFPCIVSDVCAVRQDVISSDRERAALVLALIQLSIVM